MYLAYPTSGFGSLFGATCLAMSVTTVQAAHRHMELKRESSKPQKGLIN